MLSRKPVHLVCSQRIALIAIAALSVASCISGRQPQESAERQGVLQTPSSRDFAILGRSVSLGETCLECAGCCRGDISGGHVGGRDSVSISGNVTVESPFQVQGDSIFLDGGAVGDVFTNHLVGNGAHGKVSPFLSLPSF